MLTFTCFFQGGLKAVIWTDVFQFTVMFTGIFAVIIKVIVPIDCTYIRDVYSYKFVKKIHQIGKMFIKTSLETILSIPCFIYQGTIHVGGISKTWNIANENGRLNWFK